MEGVGGDGISYRRDVFFAYVILEEWIWFLRTSNGSTLTASKEDYRLGFKVWL